MSFYAEGSTYRNQLHYALKTALVREAAKRGKNLAWIEAERKVMLTLVNQERQKHGRDPVTLEDVERVERSAVGHSDYAHKFALYCAELAEEAL